MSPLGYLLKLEQYREDYNGACARMSYTSREMVSNLFLIILHERYCLYIIVKEYSINKAVITLNAFYDYYKPLQDSNISTFQK